MLKIIIKNSKSVHKTEIKYNTLRNKIITLITKEESSLKKSCHGHKKKHKLDSDENKNQSLTKHEFLEQMMVNYFNKD